MSGVLAGVAAMTAEGFDAFFAREYAALAGYCESLVGAGRADEVAQETMTRVYARWPLREPRAYAFRVATNVVRDEWRARRRELETWERSEARRPRADAPDPEVWDVVHRLPERLRTVVLLHYLADLPVAEVAVAVRRPVGTVKQRLHEARGRLAAQLEEER